MQLSNKWVFCYFKGWYVIVAFVNYCSCYSNPFYWASSFAYIVRLYDSYVSTVLTKSLKVQLKQVYQLASKDSSLIVTQLQMQQVNLTDCGVLSIAYAYHLALGDEPSALNFHYKELRRHLVECFEKELLSPFPQLQEQSSLPCAKKYRKI